MGGRRARIPHREEEGVRPLDSRGAVTHDVDFATLVFLALDQIISFTPK